MNAYAGTVLGCFTTLDILTSLMMVQLQLKHAGECMTENSRYLHLSNKYISFVVNKHLITNTWNM